MIGKCNTGGGKPTQEKTVTPTAAGLVVTPDAGKLINKVTVNGDSDLVAGNIKKGVDIFGVTGTLKPSAPNGTSWTKSNITGNFEDGVYNANGMWVTANATGIYYSLDGKSWMQSNITSIPGQYLPVIYTIIYKAGIWVINSRNGIYYSTDGKNWTQSNLTSDNLDLKFANGIWLATSNNNGYESGIYYSTDGKTWTQSNLTSGGFFIYEDVNGVFVASGSNGVYYSLDGKSWMQSNITTSSGFEDIYCVNGLWLASGRNGIYYSTDGKTWVQSNITDNIYDYSKISYSKGVWVISCNSSYIYYSTDGKNWTKLTFSGKWHTMYIEATGTWLMYSSYIGYRNGIYYSLDGKTWTQSSLTSGFFYNFLYEDGVIVAVGGFGYSTYTSGIYYSTDGGITWTQSNCMNTEVRTVTNANGIWLAYDRGFGAGELYYSVDGKVWSEITITDFKPKIIENANGLWVMCGNTGLYYSVTWEAS